jgi:pyridoxamine 5'-phosphate oxidase family protein
MTTFNPEVLAYLRSQRLGRLATAGADGRPHVVPVSFRVDERAGTVEIGGHRFGERKKYRDVQRNPWAAIVVDDLASVDPWRPRMVEIRGRAEALATGGADIMPGFAQEMIRIHADRVVSYGLDQDGRP